GFDISAVLQAGILPGAADGRQGLAGLVVDELGVYVLAAAKHAQSRPLGGPLDSVAHAEASPLLAYRLGALLVHALIPSTRWARDCRPRSESSIIEVQAAQVAPLAKDLPSLRRTTSLS